MKFFCVYQILQCNLYAGCRWLVSTHDTVFTTVAWVLFYVYIECIPWRTHSVC